MAKYRPIYQKIWKDPDFQKYSPNGKLLFIYLCTNESTTESGIYPITIKTTADETGLPTQSVTNLLNNLKNVLYDSVNNFVFLKKFRVYNAGGKPELIAKSIINDFLSSPQTPLWSDFIQCYAQYREDILSVGNPIPNPCTTVSQPLLIPNPTIKTENIEREPQPLDNGLTTIDDGSSKIPINVIGKGIITNNNVIVSQIPKLSNNYILREMQIYLGYPEKHQVQPIPLIGKELGFIKTLRQRGVQDEDVIQCWKQKVDYKKGSFVSLQWVNNDILEWLNNGKKLVFYSNNGHKDISVEGNKPAGAFAKYEQRDRDESLSKL